MDQGLEVPHGQVLLHAFFRRVDKERLVLQTEERPRVSRGEQPVAQHGPHGFGEVQKPQGVGHGAPRFAHLLRHLLLRQAPAVDEGLEGGGFLEGGQILPLQVLDQRDPGRRRVVRLHHHHGELLQPRQLRCAEPALAGDDLVAVRGGPAHQHGLQKPVPGDGVRQLAESVRGWSAFTSISDTLTLRRSAPAFSSGRELSR